MDAVKNDVKRLVKIELAAANRKFRMFASNHEGVAVIQEEAVEAAREMDGLHRELNAIGALSESLHHFDVVNYEEDPPVRPCWGKCYGILKEGYYDCPICGYMTNWQPEICPVCHTRLEMWDGKGK